MPTYSVAELLAETPENIAAGAMGDYSLTERDMRVALALFNRHKPRNVLDFGCNWGNTAALVLANCPFVELWLGVDLRPELFPKRGIVPQEAGHLARHDPRFRLILTDETVDDLQRQLCGLGLTFDAILMDANHEEAPTRRDTEACEPFAASPCLWLWHDYNVDSRQQPTGRPFPVKAYLDRLIAAGRPIMVPDEADRHPWRCVSLAWEVR